MNELIPMAHLRLTQLLMSMLDASKQKDKAQLLRLLRMFEDDYDGFVDLLASQAGLTDEDISSLVPSEDEATLLTQAAVLQHGYRLPVVVGAKEKSEVVDRILSSQTPPQ